MANEVFANGREVACKAADGKTVSAFPDVCLSPGAPSGIPVPYPNTAYAKDTAAGSKTVKISGKPVILKNKSYFKTSVGNEAGNVNTKGVATGVNKGKAYFNSWSMDVKVEGLNVCRHLDLTTHNHGSFSGNTGVWKYLDTDTKSKCKDEIKDVEKKCDLSKKDKKKIKEAKKKSILKNNDPPTWKDKYCKGLGIKIMTKELTPDEIKEKLEELTDVSKQAEKAMGQVKEILIDKATEYAAKKTAKVIAKSAVKGWLGPVGWAWTAYDVVSTGFEIKDMYDEIDNLKEDINRMKNLPTEIEKMKADGITADDLHNAQALIAAMNPCLRARKCMLVPYSPTKQNKKKKGDGDTRGCCPGQTPHHLIPKSHFIKDKKNIAKCRGYDEQEAPTVCAEGPSYNKGGTHQSIHDVIEPLIMKKADDKGKLTYAQARENAIKSHELIYGQCKEKCLEAQIDNYHKKACGRKRSDFKVRASSPKNLLNGGTYSNKPNRNGGGDGSKL